MSRMNPLWVLGRPNSGAAPEQPLGLPGQISLATAQKAKCIPGTRSLVDGSGTPTRGVPY